jgi:hypothetical protein
LLWLVILRMKHRTVLWFHKADYYGDISSWAQHASTQPPGSDFKFVSRSYNAGSV